MRFGQYLQIVIVVAFAVVLGLVALSAARVTRGITRTAGAPEHMVRLQVVDGSGVPSLDKEISGRLADYRDEDLHIVVVGADEFGLRKVPKSFVIARDGDRSAAVLLARKIGLDPSDVVYKPLENNYSQVSATLVLGEDHERVSRPQPRNKES